MMMRSHRFTPAIWARNGTAKDWFGSTRTSSLYNRLAKHQGRNAFGFRNPVNQRRRIRWACTRQHRRASAARSTLPA